MRVIEKYNELEDRLDELDFLEDTKEYLEVLEEIYLFFQKVVIKENTKTLDEYIENHLHGSTYLISLLTKNELIKYYLVSKDERILKYLLKFSNMILNTFEVTYLTREFIYVYATSIYFLGMAKEAKDIVKYYIDKDNTFATGHVFLAETMLIENKEKEAIKYLEKVEKEILDLEEKVKILEALVEIKKCSKESTAEVEFNLKKIYSEISKQRRSTFWYPKIEKDKDFLEVVSEYLDMSKLVGFLQIEKIEDLKETNVEIELEENVVEYLEKCKAADNALDKYTHIKIGYALEDAFVKIEAKINALEAKGYTMSSIDIATSTIKYIVSNDICFNIDKESIVNEYLFKLKSILKRNKMTYEKHKEIIDNLKDIVKLETENVNIKYMCIREIIALTNKQDVVNAFYLKQTMNNIKEDIQSYYEIEYDYLIKFESADKFLDTVENKNVIKSIKLLNKVLDMYLLTEKNKEIEIVIYYATKYAATIEDIEERLIYIKNLFIYKKLLAKSSGDFKKYKEYLKNETLLFPYITRITECLEYIDIEELLEEINIKEIRLRREDPSYMQLITYLINKEMYKELLDVIKEDIYMLLEKEKYCTMYSKSKVIKIYKSYLKNLKCKTKYDLEVKNKVESRAAYLEEN